MQFLYLALLLLAAARSQELPLAEPCDENVCRPPSCRCSSTNIPDNYAPRHIPQFVVVTFDDAVNTINIETYRQSLYGRLNSNNCPASATFFINHEYTNYQLVNELYNQGFEIALHSISHRGPQTWWATATHQEMLEEIGQQRQQMSHFANIPLEEIGGVRIPFLQMTGNASFQAMADVGLRYDSTWTTVSFIDPPLWPYTLDYASTQDCQTPPCPNASIPGPWVLPMVSWLDLENVACAMVDTCYFVPALDNEEEWFRFIVRNFERHYLTNRAPFGFYVHEWYLRTYPSIQRALERFLDVVNNLEDAFMVSADQIIDWMKNPIPVNIYRTEPCKRFTPTVCPATTCGPLVGQHNQLAYWMTICTTCPRTYPWVGNPLGQ